MLWFKHLSAASRSASIAEIEDRFGLEGYARYWKLVEAIAENMEKGGPAVLALPWSKWAAILGGKPNKLRLFLEHLANQLEIKLKQTGNILEIEFPNLLKWRDEWQVRLGSKSRETPEQEIETEIETDKNVLSLEEKVPKRAISKNADGSAHSEDEPHYSIDAEEFLERNKGMSAEELGARVEALCTLDLSKPLLPGWTRAGDWTEMTLKKWRQDAQGIDHSERTAGA